VFSPSQAAPDGLLVNEGAERRGKHPPPAGGTLFTKEGGVERPFVFALFRKEGGSAEPGVFHCATNFIVI